MMKQEEALDVDAQKARVEANKAAEATASTDPMDSDEVAIAAGHYGSMCKTIRGYAKNMSGKGLARVVIAFSEFPYGQNYPKFRSDAEQKLFTFLLSVQSAKAVIAEALKPQLGQIQAEAEAGLVKEIQEEQKGETNG